MTKETPEFTGKIAPMEINEIENKLIDLNAMIEKKLVRINEIEAIIDRYYFLSGGLYEKEDESQEKKTLTEDEEKYAEMTPADINKLELEKEKLIKEKNPLETIYDAMLEQKKKVLKRKTLLN